MQANLTVRRRLVVDFCDVLAGGEHAAPPALRGCRGARRRGAVVAAISTSVPDVRWESRPEHEWAAPVLAAAAELSTQLGYRNP